MKQSIYNLISENLSNDGDLPKDFSIYNITYSNDPFVMDGAKDAYTFLHERKTIIEVQRVKKYKQIFAQMNKGNVDKVWPKLAAHLLVDGTTRILDFLMNQVAEVRKGAYYEDFLDHCLRSLEESHNPELIKFSLTALGSEANFIDPYYRDIIRTLAVSDEFSFYTSFVLSNWPNAKNELFNIAKKVYGWGRIMLMPRLDLEDQDVIFWLFTEGYKNTAKPEYQVSAILNHSSLVNYLEGRDLSDEAFYTLSRIIYYSIKPQAGVLRFYDSNVSVQMRLVKIWLKECFRHDFTFETIYIYVNFLQTYKRIQFMLEENNIEDFTSESTESPQQLIVNFSWLQFYLVEDELNEVVDTLESRFNFDDFKNICKAYGGNYLEKFYALFGTINMNKDVKEEISQKPFSYIDLLSFLSVRNHPYTEYILDAYADIIPLVELANGPNTKRSSEALSLEENLLSAVLAASRGSDFSNREFIISALQSSSASLRSSALFSIYVSLVKRQDSLKNIDPELEKLVQLVMGFEVQPKLMRHEHQIIQYR